MGFLAWSFCVPPRGPTAPSASGCSTSTARRRMRRTKGCVRIAADPDALLGGAGENLSAEEKAGARRERDREGSGIGGTRWTRRSTCCLHALGPPVRGRVADRNGVRPARTRAGDRPPAVAGRTAHRLRGRRRAACHRQGGRGRPRRRRSRTPVPPVRLLRHGRVHRGRGRAPLARLLVGAGVPPAAGRPCRHGRRTAVVDLRSRAPGPASRPGLLSRRGHARRLGAAVRRRPRRRGHVRRWSGTGRVTPVWPGSTGRPRAHRCCWYRPATSASRCVWRSTRRAGRPAPSMRSGIRRGCSSSPGCPPGRRTARPGRDRRRRGARVVVVGEQALTGARLQPQAVLDVGEDDLLVSAMAGRMPPSETGDARVPGR